MALFGRSNKGSSIRRWLTGLLFLALTGFLVGLFARLALVRGWFAGLDALVDVAQPSASSLNLARALSSATTAQSVAIVSIVFFLLLLLRRRGGDGITLLGAGFTAVVAQNLIADWVDRVPVTDAAIPSTSSFPSSHSFYAVAVYGLFACFFVRSLKSLKWKVLIGLLATLLVALTAYGRLLLGEQLPSDVLFGLILGLVWLVVGLRVTRRPAKEEGGLSFRR